MQLKQQIINLSRQSMDCESSPDHRFQGQREELLSHPPAE